MLSAVIEHVNEQMPEQYGLIDAVRHGGEYSRGEFFVGQAFDVGEIGVVNLIGEGVQRRDIGKVLEGARIPDRLPMLAERQIFFLDGHDMEESLVQAALIGFLTRIPLIRRDIGGFIEQAFIGVVTVLKHHQEHGWREHGI